MTLATWITLTRLLGIPFLLYALHEPTVLSQWLGCGVFLLAASTDWLDGYIARRFNQVTELGKFLDPLVDKLLVITPLLSLLVLGKVPVVGVFLIIARELTVAGWRVNQSTISGANLWGKLKTVAQIVAIALLIAPLPPPWQIIGMVFFWFAVGLTLFSGLIYLWPTKPQVQFQSISVRASSIESEDTVPEEVVLEPHSDLQVMTQNLALLQNLYEFKSGFLSRVSHELRSPLNGIIGTHQLILSGLCDSPEEEREFLQHANQSTLNLIGMLDTVLKVAKVEAGKTPLNFKAFSALDLLQDVGDLSSMQATDANLRLQVILPDQDWSIWGDEPCLRQLLLNVVREFMQTILNSSEKLGAIQLSANPLPEQQQIQLTVAAELPFQAWSESRDTLEKLRSPNPLIAQEIIAQPTATLSPAFKLWLDYTLLEQMNGTFTCFEREPGWTCIQFGVPLA